MTLATDFDMTGGLNGSLVSDRALLVQSLARRLRTRRGALFYDPDYGSFLPDYLGESFTDGGAEAAAIAELDLEEDPRVLTADVSVLSYDLSSVQLQAQLVTTGGPLALLLTATAASTLYPAQIEFTPYGVG